jgi:Ca-activated chloride channel family protein
MIDWSALHFLRPWWWLGLIPLAVLIWALARRRHGTGGWAAVVDPQLLPFVLAREAQHRTRPWALYLTFLGSLLAIAALAGPSWERLPQPVYREQSSVVFALDLSRSMDASDTRPSRLVRARFKLADLLNRRDTGETALIVYAGEAYAVTPLTDDKDTILAQLPALATDLMPSRGSRADLAIRDAGQLLEQAGATRGQVVLITDGVDLDRALEAVRGLRDQGHRLSVLGVGTPQGAPIPLKGGGFLNDAKGAIVIPKLDEAALRELAGAGAGVYRALRTDDGDIDALTPWFDGRPLGDQGEETGLKTEVWREEGPWLLLLLLPLAALAFRRGQLVMLLILLAPLPRGVQALDWPGLWLRPDQQASRALAEGDAKRAAALYTDPAWKGVAEYRAGNYQQAVQALQGLDTAQAWYNKGNALARLGRYPQAIAAYEEALRRDSGIEDARYNRDLLRREQQREPAPSPGKDPDREPDPKGDQGGGSAEDQASGEGRQQHGQRQRPGEETAQQQPRSATQRPQGEAGEDSPEPDAETPGEHQDGPSANGQDKDLARAEVDPDRPPDDEAQQAMEQWLRRIPDDPGGLLRRKFYYQYRRQRQAQINDEHPW